MLTGPGLSLASWAGRQKSTPWAIMLFIGYWLMFAAEFSMIRFHLGEDGKWVASTTDVPEAWMGLVVFAVAALSLVGAIGYMYSLTRESKQTLWLWGNHELTGNDVVHIVAWMHVFQTIVLVVYGLVLEDTLFAVGTVAGTLESAVFQLFLLILIPLWFRGRLGEIGVRRPVRIKQMLVLLLLLFLLIALLLDVVVTNPIADWFGLSLSSEREQQIEKEIVTAKDTDMLAAVASLVVIGIMVPIAEEILFRGVIQTYLVRRIGAVAGIILSSLWFALLHIDVALFAPLFVIGLGLGFVRHRYQSIWGAVVLHAVNNMMGVLYYFN
ncbi:MULTISPECIES: CPBP family intramembrane glutamic endopeptidase [Brevibacillus]|jgi:Predicted metal-dependent membrane protease|uniref:CAAX prenyl protease 2/Lysostaphin resistance protein A-like domain-containing protein n=1 Tax=Brevibacillus parabrevis TaxID=54914 RepID=A0A4Y3PSH3_BREPA|nr:MULTISPECIES: CPBP family intramembrane glutamic endopeptidase [Brevibacillus]MBU8716000.1 CPBP family intramembrane metalloprotease [Brevibacillus parabrevis]MDH6353071.1 membrane protease YdiL (CAAX protease family) [Brevibacillus sp. 1238]MDR5002649.1 CPBP family intramembrane metalloprotease [Brevibacillus parabrevis]MED2256960.1 CPBP family intramembrane metalloprotease [Brevibacillus parabrevis]NRQ56560.1 CPBP family intramembrane metalloprotease [Brevibacillus sp. HD1.4A]